MDWNALVQSVVWLLLIIDPLGNLPFFMAATHSKSSFERRQTFSLATFVAFLLMLIFILGGMTVLNLFKVTLADLQIAGGLLLLIIAVRIVLFGHWGIEEEQTSIVPLACPLLTGPGAITAALVLQATHGLALTMLAVVLSFAITWAVLMFGERLFALLGKTGSMVLAQVMALLLATIAIQFIRSGFSEAIRSIGI
ncbi:MAG: MarC family protein [Armatimonadetes bacterium]|nr:MarC family protein [Armatimonadota bacterium]MDW8029976.1 MarC family protein [Armatimonadota bacterium]